MRRFLLAAFACVATATFMANCTDDAKFDEDDEDDGAGASSTGGNGQGAMGQGGSGATGGMGGMGGNGTGGVPDPPCDLNDITVASEFAELDQNILYYEGDTSATAPADSIAIELYYDFGATMGPHTYTFTGESYEDCHTCALMYENCDLNLECDAIYLITEGTLDITANGAVGTQFTGTLTNAKFAEVDLDSDFNSTWVDNGFGWCVASHTFDVTITMP